MDTLSDPMSADTPEFQRLRDLKQVGVIHFIFPGASHNRFEHSVGVSTLANRLISEIHHRQPDLEVSKRDIRCVTLAGLCHDLGHGPFSHAFESWLHRQHIPFHHEDMSLKLLDYMVDANSIDIEKEDIRFIQSLISGKPDNPRTTQLEGRSWMFDIVANRRNSIDVDKWDYLARDCYCLGMKSSYDFSRLMSYSRVINDEICFHAKEAYNIYEMFHTRYSLFKQVYSHRVGKAIEFMIGDAFKLADPYMKISDAINDPAEYCLLTDTLLKQIETSKGTELQPARDLIKRIRKRDLYKMADEVLLPASQARAAKEITAETLSSESIKLQSSANVELRSSDIHIDTFTCNYAMKDKNPVDSVHFFNKWSDTESFPLEKEKVSLLIPQTFSETYLRIFCTQAHQVRSAQLSFRSLLRSKGAGGGAPGPEHLIPHPLSRTITPPSLNFKRDRQSSEGDFLDLQTSPSKKPKFN